nr:DUF6508 domain-containing protein [uncultured Niameybacter sp.]
MKDCKTLFKFITYFEDPMVIQLGYRQQDDEITAFVDEVYQCGILNKDYFKALQECEPGGDYQSLIEEANFEQLRLLISYYVCQKNFSSTLWEKPIKEKIFLRILFRLQALVEKED